MNTVLVLGAGLVAGPLVRYLFGLPNVRVVVGDVEPGRAEALVAGRAAGRALKVDLADEAALRSAVSGADLVISMVPYTFHPRVARISIALGKNMLTASYAGPELRALSAEAERAGVLVLNELGLDPGIDHMEALRVIREAQAAGGRVESFISYCGGLPAPEANDNPLGYKFSWSPRGVLLASRNSARFLRDGRLVTIPAERLFASPASIDVPGLGSFEGYPNRDSAPYVETYGIPDTRTCLRGTLRWPGWCETLLRLGEVGYLDLEARPLAGLTYGRLLLALAGAPGGSDPRGAAATKLALPAEAPVLDRMAWLGLFDDEPVPLANGSALDVLTARMVERLRYQPGERDMIVLRHEFLVRQAGGRLERIQSTLIDYGVPGGDSSMSRTVGLPVAIAARLVLEGRIGRKGVLIPTFPEAYLPILAELRTLGVEFREERDYPA